MAGYFVTAKRAQQIFCCPLSIAEIENGVGKTLPSFSKSSDGRRLKSWSAEDVPAVGAKLGFIKNLAGPTVAAVFVTKGGVLKTSLTLNLARMAALHGLRTCVIGLDMQGDVSAALTPEDDSPNVEAALNIEEQKIGLVDFYSGHVKISELLCHTDLPTLQFIAETPELVALDQTLMQRNRREYWLKENVIEPLKEKYDLILLDCSPNWNRLITNALVSCDVLISPVECKINNFRNLKTFSALITEFKKDLHLTFSQIYVPTKLSAQRKLSREICSWYQAHLTPCTHASLRESNIGEESSALHLSVIEYAPLSEAASEMRDLIKEIWNHFKLKKDAVNLNGISARIESSQTELGI